MNDIHKTHNHSTRILTCTVMNFIQFGQKMYKITTFIYALT